MRWGHCRPPQEHPTPNPAGKHPPTPTRPSVCDGTEAGGAGWCLGEHTRGIGEVGQCQGLCTGAQDLGVGCGSAFEITPWSQSDQSSVWGCSRWRRAFSSWVMPPFDVPPAHHPSPVPGEAVPGSQPLLGSWGPHLQRGLMNMAGAPQTPQLPTSPCAAPVLLQPQCLRDLGPSGQAGPPSLTPIHAGKSSQSLDFAFPPIYLGSCTETLCNKLKQRPCGCMRKGKAEWDLW